MNTKVVTNIRKFIIDGYEGYVTEYENVWNGEWWEEEDRKIAVTLMKDGDVVDEQIFEDAGFSWIKMAKLAIKQYEASLT